MLFKDTPFGSPEAFNVLVEIEQGSNLKYEYDETTDSLKLDFTFKNLAFPFSYGSIAQTLGGDGDPLDAMVLALRVIPSGTIVKCKAVGILKTIDRGEIDDKIIAVPLGDDLAKKYNDITDLPPGSLEQWKDFYAEVARQKNKMLHVNGWQNREKALEEIQKSVK